MPSFSKYILCFFYNYFFFFFYFFFLLLLPLLVLLLTENRTEDQHLEDGFTWDDYRQLVFQLKTSDVYDNSYTGIAKILTYNIFEVTLTFNLNNIHFLKGYFLDNTPLRNFLAPWFKKMNYTTLGDLYIPTSLTVVNQSSGTYVMNSLK
jgi:hypothetical protein